MRRRLLVSFIGVALLTVVLVCLPLAVVGTRYIEADFDHRLERNLQTAATALNAMSARGVRITEATLTPLIPGDREAVYRARSGEVLIVGHIHGGVRSVSTSISTGRLTMNAPASLLHARVRNLWLVILGAGLAAVLFAAFVADRLARRLNHPLAVLSASAERMGHGDLRPSGVRFGIAELDHLAVALDVSVTRLRKLLEEERLFVRNTSHELRTPLTSLSVRLDDIQRRTDDPGLRAELDAALRQVERLTQVTSAVLTQRAAGLHATEPVDAAPMLARQREEWAPAFGKRGRTLTVDVPQQLRLLGDPIPLGRALAALLDNALVHGGGDVVLRGRRIARHVVLDVSDEGDGVAEDLAPHIFVSGMTIGGGTGLGLPLARALVEGMGGRLELSCRQPARFSIFLPGAD